MQRECVFYGLTILLEKFPRLSKRHPSKNHLTELLRPIWTSTTRRKTLNKFDIPRKKRMEIWFTWGNLPRIHRRSKQITSIYFVNLVSTLPFHADPRGMPAKMKSFLRYIKVTTPIIALKLHIKPNHVNANQKKHHMSYRHRRIMVYENLNTGKKK